MLTLTFFKTLDQFQILYFVEARWEGCGRRSLRRLCLFNLMNTLFKMNYMKSFRQRTNHVIHAQKWTTWSMLSTTCCNVVLHTVQQCCAAPCQQLLSTTIVHSCSRSATIVQSLLTTINNLFSSTIVSSCSNNIVTTIVLCQHRTTIDRTILINIVNSTSVVEPW